MGQLSDAQVAERRHAAAARWAGHHGSTPTKLLIARLPDRVRFAGGMTQRTAGAQTEPVRSLTRGESWQRQARGIAAIPASYTGSTVREKPAGSYLHFEVHDQRPASVPVEDHVARVQRYSNVVRNARTEVMAAAEKARPPKKHVYLKTNERVTQEKYGGVAQWRMKPELYPEGTPRGTLNRAYNHAALLSLHDRGVVNYDFKMDPHLKTELTPTIPLIRYVRRELNNRMDVSDKASGTTAYAEKKPYKDQFGTPFKPDKRTGEMRNRLKPNEQLVKAFPMAGLAGRLGAKAAAAGVAASGVRDAISAGVNHSAASVTSSASAGVSQRVGAMVGEKVASVGLGDFGGIARGAGKAIGRGAAAVYRRPVATAKYLMHDGAHLGANLGAGVAEGFGASPDAVQRSAKVGAFVGGAKVAALPAILGYHPAIRALAAMRGRKKQAQSGATPTTAGA